MDAHNIEAQVAERLAEVSRWPLSAVLRRQAAAIARLETRTVQGLDAVLSCSELDAAALRRAGAREVHLVPNGVELRQLPVGAEARNTVAFVGSYDWRPNVDAAVVLARELATAATSVPGTPAGAHRPEAAAGGPGARWRRHRGHGASG